METDHHEMINQSDARGRDDAPHVSTPSDAHRLIVLPAAAAATSSRMSPSEEEEGQVMVSSDEDA